MFRLHREQLEWFARKARADFEARMAPYLRRAYPECFGEMADDALAAWLSDAVERAVRYGITDEPDVAQFVLLLVLLGSDADEAMPWVADVLVDRDLHGVGKVRKLVELARAQDIPGVEQVVVEEVVSP